MCSDQTMAALNKIIVAESEIIIVHGLLHYQLLKSFLDEDVLMGIYPYVLNTPVSQFEEQGPSCPLDPNVVEDKEN